MIQSPVLDLLSRHQLDLGKMASHGSDDGLLLGNLFDRLGINHRRFHLEGQRQRWLLRQRRLLVRIGSGNGDSTAPIAPLPFLFRFLTLLLTELPPVGLIDLTDPIRAFLRRDRLRRLHDVELPSVRACGNCENKSPLGAVVKDVRYLDRLHASPALSRFEPEIEVRFPVRSDGPQKGNHRLTMLRRTG